MYNLFAGPRASANVGKSSYILVINFLLFLMDTHIVCSCIYTSGHTKLKQRWFSVFESMLKRSCFNVVCLLGLTFGCVQLHYLNQVAHARRSRILYKNTVMNMPRWLSQEISYTIQHSLGLKLGQHEITLSRRPRWLSRISSDWWSGGRKYEYEYDPNYVRQHSFVEIDHEVFSTVILSIHWFKKGCRQFLAKEC